MRFVIEYNGYGEIVSVTNLYNFDDEMVGYCLDFNHAYLIFDINGHVIEHCGSTNSPYYNLCTDYMDGAVGFKN